MACNARLPALRSNHVMDTRRPLPAIFLSHGSPMTALEPGAAGRFMQRLGPAIDATFGRPRAILALSAHSLARQPVLLAADRHAAVYDFGGFDPRLFTLRYDAPGAPALAVQVQSLLAGAGIAVQCVAQGGLDHGIWTPLRYAYPDADIPVLPLAWVPSDSPAALFALGQALAPLAHDGVLVVGSGSITHNLHRVFANGLNAAVEQPEIAESAAFRDWMQTRAAARDWDALFAYRARAPHAVDMHPSDEHLLPWYIAAGAGGPETGPQRLHASVTYGSLGMDAYAFGTSASSLAAALN
jgi:4,5-DOPA dioxygenase extradiol